MGSTGAYGDPSQDSLLSRSRLENAVHGTPAVARPTLKTEAPTERGSPDPHEPSCKRDNADLGIRARAPASVHGQRGGSPLWAYVTGLKPNVTASS